MPKPRRFTEEQAQEIRLLHEHEKRSTRSLAEQYQCGVQTIIETIKRAGGTVRSNRDANLLRRNIKRISSNRREYLSTWLKKHPLTPDASQLGGHGVKMRENTWRLLREMAAKRNLPLGEYIARLVEADALRDE